MLTSDGVIAEGLPQRRVSPFSAFVNIMYGCNNFCSYCIVPYVRGRERSRKPEAVLEECKRLVDQGVKEITLLGQNVNSYRGGGSEFSELLRRVDALGVPRIRFMTSHPKDLSDELIAAYGELKHLMPALHLPVQAGNDEILAAMNRRYTRAHYLELVNKLRSVRPDVGLTSDIIVGFPGGKRRRNSRTRSPLCAKSATIPPSPSSTPNARARRRRRCPIPRARRRRPSAYSASSTCKRRFTHEILTSQVGKRETVLVESLSARDEGWVGGKTPRGHMVNFPGNADLIGKSVQVEILSAGRNTLRGRQITEV